MKKILIAAVGAAVSMNVFAQAALNVNGKVISAQEQRQIMQALEKQGITNADQRLALAREHLITQTLINQEAAKQKVSSDPAVKLKLAAQRTELLKNELVRNKLAKSPVTEAEAKKVYEQFKKNFNPNEVKIQHLVVKSEAEAKKIIAEVKDGEDLVEIAEDKKIKQQVDLPFAHISNFNNVPGLADAIMSLDKGQVRPIPFKSPVGYHVIKLVDKRTVEAPAFSKVKPQMEQLAAQQKAQNYLSSLAKNAKISEVPAKK